jgi:UDP:flavonoid glycosyltransferase YjiC (YdhE family)
MPHIVYYVTSHGYGHAVRTAAICNEFSKNVRLTIRTALPETFFREEIKKNFSYAPASFDCGCIQKDSLSIDIGKTLSTYRAIAARNVSLLESESQWCRAQKAGVIVSDIVPFAFEAAHTCGIPSVAVTNFTWYDIYEDYVRLFPDYQSELEKIRSQYAHAAFVLALDPSLPMACFKKRLAVPPVGRKACNRRAEILHTYGLGPDKHLGLMYFGHLGISGMDLRKLEAFNDWEFLGISPIDCAPSNYRLIPKTDFPYQDLVASVDLLICKIGYGAAAEAMINGTPLLYPPRENFAEYPVLDAAARSWGGGNTLSREAFIALDWEPTFAAVIENGRTKPLRRRSNGARICAAAIENLSYNSCIHA